VIAKPRDIAAFEERNGKGLVVILGTVTPDQQLLLRAALDEPEPALRCFNEWWKYVEIEHTGTTEYRLLPLVYRNIGPLIADKVAAARVKGVAKHVWVSNSRKAALGAYVLDILTMANVPHAVLKGAAMMTAVHADNMRSIGDCDILIPVERAPQALAALAEVDLHAQFPLSRFAASEFKRHHGVSVGRPGEQAYQLDIHWRPLRNVGADELTGEFFHHSVLCELSGRKTRRPCFEHMLLHTVVHGTAWAAVPRYDWLADAALIVRAAGAEFDWRRLADTVARYRLGSIMHAALNQLALTVHVQIPEQALRRLAKGRVIDRAEAYWRTIDPKRVPFLGKHILTLQILRRQESQLARRSVLAALPKIWRSLFDPPPRALMRAAMAIGDDDHVIYLSGWQDLERIDGRWTDGSLAVLGIQRAPGRQANFLRLTGYTLAPPNAPQVVDVYSGWRRLARLTWPSQKLCTQVISLPQSLRSREVLMLQLHIRRPIEPGAIGLNKDTRRLGLFLQDIRTTLSVRDATAVALNLSDGSCDAPVLWSGWSHPEPGGCWTDGPNAVLRWISQRDLPHDAHLIMRCFAFAPDGEPLKGSLSINNRPAGNLARLQSSSGPTDLSVPIGPLPGDREIDVQIRIENPRSPRDAGLSSDERKLGLFVQSVRIAHPNGASRSGSANSAAL